MAGKSSPLRKVVRKAGGTRPKSAIEQVKARQSRVQKDAKGRSKERAARLNSNQADVKRQLKIQKALYEIADAASAVRDMQSFYKKLHKIVGRLMYAENFFIALYDDTSGLLSYPYFVDEYDKVSLPRPLTEVHNATSWIIRTGEMFRHGSEWNDLFLEMVARKEIELEGTYSGDGIAVPLKAEGKTLGAIFVQSYTPEIHYTDQDDEVLAFVAQHIATALTRARALEAERQRTEELAIVNGISQAMSQRLDMGGIIRIVGDKVREIFNAEVTEILLLDESTNLIHARYSYYLGYQQFEPFAFGEGMTSRIIQSRAPIIHHTLEEAVRKGALFQA